MLKCKGKIADNLIQKLMNWRHSGFSVYAGNRIARDDKADQVLYRSGMTHGRNKKNFEISPANEFVGRITQHIPEKGFQMVRYYVVLKQVHGAAAQGGNAETWGYAVRKRGQRGFHHTGRI